MNKVFIRGMYVSKYKYDNRITIAISCKTGSQNEANYQYVTFFDKPSMDYIENTLRVFDTIVVEATASLYTKKDEKIDMNNVRLRGESIEKNIDFIKRNFTSRGIPIFGLQFKNCVRFEFVGSIASISNNGRSISIAMRVQNPVGNGFSLMRLFYNNHKDPEAINLTMSQYKKGDEIAVRGFIAQSRELELNEDGEPDKYSYFNKYMITSFLTNKEDDLDDVSLEDNGMNQIDE